MAKVKYYAKENSSIGTHSFYAVPIPNGTLTTEEADVGEGRKSKVKVKTAKAGLNGRLN